MVVNWQKILNQGFNSASELLQFLGLPPSLSNGLSERAFKTRVPRGFVARMQMKNPQDPLLLQVLAVAEELQIRPDYSDDPLDESEANKIPGLLHKYHGRVLLTLVGACAVNCRYCFRRHFPYQDNNPSAQEWEQALSYISNDCTITEVILSGGDPLLLVDSKLTKFFHRLEKISHVKTIRIHSRIPIVLPERITEQFLETLRHSRLRKVVVLHCNHPQEIDKSVHAACHALKKAQCTLLNQSVLLKGINDQAETLASLSERLFDCGVLPYYLHVLDKVQGAAHFDTPLAQALMIYAQLQSLVPGYLLPKLAREDAGETSKTLLSGVLSKPFD